MDVIPHIVSDIRHTSTRFQSADNKKMSDERPVWQQKPLWRPNNNAFGMSKYDRKPSNAVRLPE
jgi:hypothetical protein